MDRREFVLANKKTIILASIATIVIVAVIFFGAVFWSAKSDLKQQTDFTSGQANQAEILENYENGMKTAVKEYQQIVDDIKKGELNNDERPILLSRIKNLKDKMTEIIVPTKYKDFHIEIFFGILSSERYLADNNPEDKAKGEEALAEAKENNNWLDK